VRDQGHAQHGFRQFFGLLGIRGQLDAAAFAPTAGVDLGLDHDPRPIFFGDRPGFGGVVATSPRGIRTPNRARMLFAWNSWIFISLSREPSEWA